ncbi:hypothetical protein POV27_07555 [Aureisphaera galaxeae]|uniref:hypothetical protein n=1 Tax=Aureisphaera galaxeae TaxID=1538023 RepID=UPI002350B48D|nr:hypothetical protein [Aureisphaera galaxeae]MDC8003903.1 hypothetical protein [Aureisphaera galaxeae]
MRREYNLLIVIRKHFICMLIMLSGGHAYSQSETDLSQIKGVEIFLFESECRNDHSYITKLDLEDLLKMYKEKKSLATLPDNKCHSYLDLDECAVRSEAFLAKSDIENFDWTHSKITLTESGIQKMREQKVPIQSLPFVLKLNGESIYAGRFWNIFASGNCDRLWILQNPGAKVLQVDFGFGSPCGRDPRTEEWRIQKALASKK